MSNEQSWRQLTEQQWNEGALYGTLPYVDSFPDWTLLDDTDASRDEAGATLRDRKMTEYFDALDRHRGH